MTERETQYARALAERGEQGQPGDPIPFTASTPGVKRDGLDLRASGWRLDTYRANPVFQWAHGRSSPPIGRVESSADSQRLRTEVMFDQEDPFARTIESKYRRGFLNAVSVSWDFVDAKGEPLRYWGMTAEQLRDDAFYDLTEVSGVPVPADPTALMERQRSALRHLGHELVELFDERETPESPMTVAQFRSALADELTRLGIEIPKPPASAPVQEPEAPAAGINPDARRMLLAAFTPEGTAE